MEVGKDFNSHAHVERDGIIEIACIVLVDFNSHAHVERDGSNQGTAENGGLFQLTRSRGA